MVNESGLGYIKNRYHLFLGRWPFAPYLVAIAYRNALMVANWQFRRRRYALQSREIYEETFRLHDRTDSEYFT